MDSHARTIFKTLSWRFWATVITFFVSWLITRKFAVALEIGLADTLIKLGAYYCHERMWNRFKFGKLQGPEYNI